MIIHSGPLHHRILPSCAKSSTSDSNLRRKCELFRRHKSFSLSNDHGFQYLRIRGAREHLPSPLAVGSNVSEDTDDMYDDLFEKYGKVVFKRNDQKAVIAEVDDDAESLSFAIALAKVASDVKAADIKLLFVKPLVYWTRFFIIATAFSRPQVDAIGGRIRDLAETKFGRTATGDYKPNSWTLLDFGDVVVHIFFPPQRDYYNLEEFYGNATPIELPFEDQQRPPFRN